jgi:putative PIN family toxin of toxin-antitoxin system
VIAAVLDTNALASGIVGINRPTSASGLVVRRWRDGRFQLVTSAHILDELDDAFRKPYFRQRLSLAQIARVRRLFRADARIVPITAQVVGVATHPPDDLVLATALSAGAGYVVTGDKELQRLGSYQGVVILSPRAFLRVLDAQPPATS